MHVFGLTGGIASGKSTVGARLRARRVPVIDADVLAREVVAPGTEGLREILAAFGEGMIDATGALDRKALARVAFTDSAARQTLNRITHPRITLRVLERAAELATAGEPLACYEAALLVETGAADRFRPLVVCACSEAVQKARVLARARAEGSSSEDALARIRAQMPLSEKVAVADYVIDTNGPIEDSASQADRVLLAICDKLAVDPRRYDP